jgi:hypothetical protein
VLSKSRDIGRNSSGTIQIVAELVKASHFEILVHGEPFWWLLMPENLYPKSQTK